MVPEEDVDLCGVQSGDTSGATMEDVYPDLGLKIFRLNTSAVVKESKTVDWYCINNEIITTVQVPYINERLYCLVRLAPE